MTGTTRHAEAATGTRRSVVRIGPRTAAALVLVSSAGLAMFLWPLLIVPPEDAVGYRVQVGKQQWLLYRSLSDPAIRTVLGQNLMHDLYVARLYGEDKVDSLIEIE